MRISDWSSDVCSSDLDGARRRSRGCIAATRNSFPFKGKARMGMVFRDAAARPALKPTATRALPLRGEGVESPSSWRELKPSLREGVASLLARGGRTGTDGTPPGFPPTTLTARRNTAQADNRSEEHTYEL